MSKSVLLCIDDELGGLEVRKMVLESAGYAVLTAGSGKAGLEIFTSQRVDLVILDYAMPEMSGYEVAVELKRTSPGTPILMLSAYFPVPPEGSCGWWMNTRQKGNPQYSCLNLSVYC